MTNVVKMQDWIPPEVTDDKSMETMLTFLLEEAKRGRLNGMTGVFLLEPEDAEHEVAVGMMSSHRLAEHKYQTVGALEAIKIDLLK